MNRSALTLFATAVTGVLVVTASIGGAEAGEPITAIGGGGVVDTTLSFDYEMADRFELSPSLDPVDPTAGELGRDPWSDPEFQDYLHPASWEVTLTGIAPSAFGGVSSWEWTVTRDDGTVAGEGVGNPWTWDAPALGTYDVTLRATNSVGEALQRTDDILLDDIVVAVAGDSMASGEGNPDILGSGVPGVSGTVAKWVDPDCDRSANNFGAYAAAELEVRDPRTSVTYLNVACSGAKAIHMTELMYSGVLGGDVDGGPAGDDDKPLDGRFHPPQLTQLAAALCGYEPDDLYPELLSADLASYFNALAQGQPTVRPPSTLPADCTTPGARQIDALLMSVGINDIGFRDAILDCADVDIGFSVDGVLDLAGWLSEFNGLADLIDLVPDDILVLLEDLIERVNPFDPITGGCDQNPERVASVQEGLRALPEFLRRIDEQIADSHLLSGGAYHVQYPSAVITDACLEGLGDFGALNRLDADEIAFLDGVNNNVNAVISLPEYFGLRLWSTPVGLDLDDEGWAGHGYCEEDRYFVTLSESLAQYNNLTETTVKSPLGYLTDITVPDLSTPDPNDVIVIEEDVPAYEEEEINAAQLGILHPNRAGHEVLADRVIEEFDERNTPVTHVAEVELLGLTYVDGFSYDPSTDPRPDYLDAEILVGRPGRFGSTFERPPMWGSRLDYVTPAFATESDPYRYLPIQAQLLYDNGDGEIPSGPVEPVVVELNENRPLVVALTASMPVPNNDVVCVPADFGLPEGGLLDEPGIGITPVSAYGIAPMLPPLPNPTDPETCSPGTNRRAAGILSFFVDDDLGFGMRPDGETHKLDARALIFPESGGDPIDGYGGFELEFRITSRPVGAPTADAGGPYVVDEGDSITLDGTGSSDPDGGALQYEWSGDVLGSGPTLTFDAVDDAVLDVTLTVTDEAGESSTDATTITVRNVDPVLDVTLSDLDIDEGGGVSVEFSCTDAGVFDTHTLEVDWGHPDLVPPSPTPPTLPVCDGSSFGPFVQGYGDDGLFVFNASLTDDDGGDHTRAADVIVAGVTPVVVLTADTLDLPGGDAVVIGPGETTTLVAEVSDPGSDDLEVRWWTNKADDFLAGADPDPFPSPGAPFPVSASSIESFEASSPALVDGGVVVTDDDGESGGVPITILVTGDQQHTFGFGRWKNELESPNRLTPDEVSAYLAIVERGSSVFGHEQVPLPDGAAAVAVISTNATGRDGLARDLLRAWLDVASGAVGWRDELGGGRGRVGDLVTAAERVYLDVLATDRQLQDAASSLRPI